VTLDNVNYGMLKIATPQVIACTFRRHSAFIASKILVQLCRLKLDCISWAHFKQTHESSFQKLIIDAILKF